MTCGSCGTANPDGARFCLSCGHPLVTRSDERRVATVIFADLVGFTHLSEARDPEQVKNLVDRCFARLALDITEFGGQVDKIMGDAIVALFGAPVAHEDDAERAVRAALRMQQSIAEFKAHTDAVIQMRIGVNTGEVLVGSFHAGGEYTAMGDVVNTAQRLQTHADPGAVVVGPATYAATRDAIEYESLGELLAKGRDEPVQAWRAVSALLPPGYRRRRQETPFVGRAAEIGVLAHAIDAAVDRRRAHLALLFGEAGVGKSRLAEEVACGAKSRHRALVIEGRCVPYGEANVWWPVAEAVRQACGISTEDPLPSAERLAVVAVTAALEMPERAPEVKRIVTGLLYLMGYGVSLREIDPLRAREEAMRSVLGFVEALTRTRPVVLVVSDLHWADDLVLETIAALLDRLRGAPFVVLATARLELQDRWSIPQGRHNTVLLNLDPLDRGSTGDLLTALVDHELPSSLREALLDRSGGNPFFLEELVALLADADQAPAELRRPDAISLSELPDTLRGLVSARLDSLTPRERATLEDASVWGRSGPVEALARMGEQVHGFGDISEEVRSLTDKEILQVAGDRWSFHSDLIREVAYGTLTKADRARRHAGIAFFLEHTQPSVEEASDRTVEVVAMHYGTAAELQQELGRVEGLPPNVTLKALQWIEEAARRAERSQLLPAAEHLYTQALRLVPADQPERRIAYLLGRAGSETDQRELHEAAEDIAEAMELASKADDSALLARAVLALGEFQQKSGDLDHALVTLSRAVDLFVELGDLKGQADAQRVVGMTHIFRGDHEDAEAAIRVALKASREFGDRRGEAWALQNLAWISYVEGRSEEAERRLHASAETFQELGDSGGLSWALGLMAFVRFHQGQLFEAEELGEQILTEARERGDRWGEGMMLLLTSGVRLWSGRAGEAVEAAEHALQLFETIGDRFGQAQAQATAGRALVTAGRVTEGMRVLREALDGQVALDDGPEPDQLRLLVSVAMAGAAVQIGASDLALDALLSGQGRPLEPETIGHSDGMVAEALALLQTGDIEGGVDRLLPVIEPDDASEPSPYALSVLALALAAAGRDEEVLDLAEQVRAARRSTYLDRVNARLAELFVAARDPAAAHLTSAGDGGGAEPGASVAASFDTRYDALLEEADAADDPVAQAVSRLAASVALEAAGRADEAIDVRADAERRLDELGITGAGWRHLFEVARDATRAPALPELRA
jgi:class 3 adenylate cyclase/tetratricopeptide (TPR) repeat protein